MIIDHPKKKRRVEDAKGLVFSFTTFEVSSPMGYLSSEGEIHVTML